MALAQAIRFLRSKLGESQEGMARRLGCSTSGYAKWERGVVAPRGGVTIRMLQMCPDDESRAAFGSAIGKAGHMNAPLFLARLTPVTGRTEVDAQLRQYVSEMREALEELFQAAQAGDQNARELLRDAHDRLHRGRSTVAISREETRAAVHPPKKLQRQTGGQAPSGGPGKGRTKKKVSARARARRKNAHE
jgi:transcriptional regulator with XRE-family HTH domain